MSTQLKSMYKLIMEDLLQTKKGDPIKLKSGDAEYEKALHEVKILADKITTILSDELKDDLVKNEIIESTLKDRICVIKCPRRIREQIINKTPFLSEKVSKLIDSGELINDSFDIKINDVNTPEEKQEDFDNLKNDSDDITYQVTSKSSAGEYVIPIIIRSNEDEENFYKFNVILFAKPNTGATKQREGNVSITIAEFIPCLLWNLNASTSIGLDEVISLILNFDLNSSNYVKHDGSKRKLQKMIAYFKNVYLNDPDKKIINNKIYGAIGVYKYMKENFSNCHGECIWTDIDALKPSGYETNPGDIMIDEGDGKFISISLKTASNEKQSPPLRNTTVAAFLKFCNIINKSKQYNIVEDYFYPILKFGKSNGLFTDDEYEKLISLKDKPSAMATYTKNSKVGEKCLAIGPLRSFAINKILEIINETFENKKDLIDFFLQIQHDDNNFYILKAIEKEGAKPIKVSLNYSITDEFNIKETNIGLLIQGIKINDQTKKIEVSIRSKGNGLHGYLSYDMVSILK